MDSRIKGHLAAVFTIVLWGTTFVSTKILLNSFQPTEILCYRICIGVAALCLVYPKKMGKTTLKQELTFAAAGLCGITLYQLFENIALTYTSASNVGIIVSLSPFFTGLLAIDLVIGWREAGKLFLYWLPGGNCRDCLD